MRTTVSAPTTPQAIVGPGSKPAPGTSSPRLPAGREPSIDETPSILLVEDLEKLAASLSRGLREEGFLPVTAATGEAGLKRIAEAQVDVVILDLGLPDLDGLDVISKVRAGANRVPIIVLTARDAVASRVEALERGADDYLVKPFAFEELLARVRAVLRRSSGPRWAPLSYGGVVLEHGSLACLVWGHPVPLSPRERGLLEVFMRRRGETLTRPEILRDAFGYDFDPGTNIVDVHVAHLRRKLEGSSILIEAIRGAGYRLVSTPTHP